MNTKGSSFKTRHQAALALAVIVALAAASGALAAAAGSLDPSFDYDGKVLTNIQGEDTIYAIAIQPDGKIVVAGESKPGNFEDSDFSLARYNTNGSLDTTFDYDGKVLTDIRGEYNRADAIVIQSDGKIVVAGYDYMNTDDFALARYNSNGSLDTSFDGDGIVVTNIGGADLCYAAAIQSDGKIVVAGASDNWGEYNFALARYNTNGSLDTSFDYDGKVVTSIQTLDFAYAIAIQPDGRIIAAGESYNGSNSYDFSLARYNTDGSLDTTFDYDGKVVTDIRGQINHGNAIVLQPNGKIIVAGTTGNIDFALARYNTNGSLDSSFDGDGIVVTDFDATDQGQAVALQPDGKILMAGYSDRWDADDLALTRYNMDGSIDLNFDGDGRVLTSIGTADTGYAIALQEDGKIVAGGATDGNYSLARYDAGPLSFISTGSQDGWVLESAENSNIGGSLKATGTTLRSGDDATRKQYRSILSFNTGGLPDGAVISSVTLKIKKQGVAGGGNPLTIYQGFRVDVKKGVFGNAALQITDFQAASNGTYGPFTPALADGWYSINLTNAKANINKLATNGGLTQIRLRFSLDDNNNAVANYLSLYSGNSVVANRPQLLIEYTMP